MQPFACSPRGRRGWETDRAGRWNLGRAQLSSPIHARLSVSWANPLPRCRCFDDQADRNGMRIRKWDAVFALHQTRDRTPDHDTNNRHPNEKTEIPPNVPPRFIPCKAYAFRPIRGPKHYLPDVAHVRRTLSALPAARDLEKVDSASYHWQLSSYGRLPPGRSYPGGLATGQARSGIGQQCIECTGFSRGPDCTEAGPLT
jgi:hypothetical protein